MTIDATNLTLSDLTGMGATFDVKSGTVSITGIPFRDFRAVLTSASLTNYDRKLPVIDESTAYADMSKENARTNQLWCEGQRNFIDYLDGLVLAAGMERPAELQKVMRTISLDRKMFVQHPDKAWTTKTEQEMTDKVLRADPAMRPAPEAASYVSRIFKALFGGNKAAV